MEHFCAAKLHTICSVTKKMISDLFHTEKNMPPGTPDVSLFSARLRHLRYISTTTDEALRASDGIMLVLLFIVLYAVSCVIKFTLEHGIGHRVRNKVPSRGTRVAWLHGCRDSISAVS